MLLLGNSPYNNISWSFTRFSSYYEKFADGTTVCIDEKLPLSLPKGWMWCKINNIAFVTKLAGFEYTEHIASNLQPSGIPLFKGKNVQNGKIIYNFEAYIPETLSDQLERSQIVKKCLLTPYLGNFILAQMLER